ncbi:MFS transporter [Pseudorhizobium endolithicum]|uniref:MFS transporter n=2 Tax=Pseudorhizobium endolithicum TaxID=1191678 RepID=A0ABN7JYF2_9HYPH|nr:MFS transporter [Pseudorhizobium endolithicum]
MVSNREEREATRKHDAVDDAEDKRRPLPAERFLLGMSLVLIAFNLRPVFSSVSALLPEIRSELGLGDLGAGLLTTLPVVCLGAFSPVAPRLAQRIGTERTLLLVVLLLTFGTAIRGIPSVPLLFIGTALAGACIAVGNVLLPGLVKRDFPDRMALLTGLYTMALCGGAAAAAGLTLPAEQALGNWLGGALAIWALPAAIAAAVWLPQVFRAGRHDGRISKRVVGLWRDRLAWQVTLYMGLQSALAYCVFGWLVPILRERGLDGIAAGGIVSVSVMVQAAACLVVPHISVRGKDQRVVNAALCVISVSALLGLLFAPLSTVWIWAVLQGVGQGGLIAAAMTNIVLRSPDPLIASHLSGMAQCIGYLLASVGPLVVGLIRGWTGSFAATAFLFVALGLAAAVNGWLAGRARYVTVRVEDIPPA